MGNHDRMHPIMFKSQEKQDEWFARYHEVGFEEIHAHLVHDFGDFKALVHHFPYYGDHTEEERYGAYRLADNGLPLIHGHVHDLWKTEGSNQYNVGIDAWDGRFQTEAEIGEFFRLRGFGQ
jgi:calcineurin-like phosphoesterase family protein